jgi:hypothetical protein
LKETSREQRGESLGRRESTLDDKVEEMKFKV